MNTAKPLVPTSRLDQYRLALMPVGENTEPSALSAALLEGGPTFVDFLIGQNLAPLWQHYLQSGAIQSLSPATIDALQQARLSAAAGYLVQRAALDHIDQLFETEKIPYAVMKGVHLRERAYPDSSLRPAADIDILVMPADRKRVARVLFDAGYTVDIDLSNISHEASFTRTTVTIDLHWDIMRPGRTRVDMPAGFLLRRQRVNGFWGLSDVDALFLMLTHPAFTKYVCSPNMGLLRVADFLLWIQNRTTDWPAVVRLLDTAGLKTAAWTMLTWYRLLAAPAVAIAMQPWLNDLLPGRLRSAYLQYWLTRDLPSRWLNRPLRIQLGFTLFLHDRLSDAGRALAGWLRSRYRRRRDAGLLLDEGISN